MSLTNEQLYEFELNKLRAENERLRADLATFDKDTEATENRIIDAEFDAQSLRVAGEAFRLAVVQSGALNHVPQSTYIDQLRAFEGALAARHQQSGSE